MSQSRAELVLLLPLPSISSLRSPCFDSLCEHLPRLLLHLPQPPAQPLPGQNRPSHHPSPWEAVRSFAVVDPPLRSSSAQINPQNGFAVSSSSSRPLPCEFRRRNAAAHSRHGLAGHDRSDRFGQPVRPIVVLGDFLVFIVSAKTCRLHNKSRKNDKNTKLVWLDWLYLYLQGKHIYSCKVSFFTLVRN